MYRRPKRPTNPGLLQNQYQHQRQKPAIQTPGPNQPIRRAPTKCDAQYGAVKRSTLTTPPVPGA